MNQPDLRADAVPRGVVALAVHDVDSPQVLRRHRHVVVYVAGHLLGTVIRKLLNDLLCGLIMYLIILLF